jgi:hypothetical protein
MRDRMKDDRFTPKRGHSGRRAGASPVGRRVTYWRRFSSIGLESHLR